MRVLGYCTCGLLLVAPLVCAVYVAWPAPVPASTATVASIGFAAWALVSFCLMLDSRRLAKAIGRARGPHTDPAQVLFSILSLVNFLTCVVALLASSFR